MPAPWAGTRHWKANLGNGNYGVREDNVYMHMRGRFTS